MFDLRYHVVTIAAIFLALGLGIVIGVAIENPEPLADRTENLRLRGDIADLQRRLDAAETRLQQRRAADAFLDRAYEAVMHQRLAGRRIAVVCVGAMDDRVDEVLAAIDDAGGTVIRIRALQLPADSDPIETALRSRPTFAGYVGDDHLDDVGRDLAREIVDGGRTPLLDLLSPVLVQQRSGDVDLPADGVVVVRSAEPQTGPLAPFVRGLYDGLAGAPAAVGADIASARPSAIATFDRAGLSTIDNVEADPGKVALAVLLSGGARGNYGVHRAISPDGILPPIEPVSPPPTAFD